MTHMSQSGLKEAASLPEVWGGVHLNFPHSNFAYKMRHFKLKYLDSFVLGQNFIEMSQALVSGVKLVLVF